MKPQQQDNEAKQNSHVYVQMPDGEEVHIPKQQEAIEGKSDAGAQTADKMPTQASGEVTSGEDA